MKLGLKFGLIRPAAHGESPLSQISWPGRSGFGRLESSNSPRFGIAGPQESY